MAFLALSPVLLSIIITSVLSILFLFILDAYKWLHLPPGPTPLPFFGNQLPPSQPWLQFQTWSKKYGPVFTIWAGRRPTLVISDPIIASELLEKRSSKYSSRPRFVVMGEIYNTPSVLVQPYGKEWLLRRKLLHQALTPKALETYMERQEAEATRLLGGIVSSSADWEKKIDRFTSSVVFTISYGRKIDSLESRIIRERLDLMQFMASLNVPGAYLAESLPILKYVPSCMAAWKNKIHEMAATEAKSNMKLVDDVRKDIKAAREQGADAVRSLTRTLLEVQEEQGIALSEKDFSFVPASLFGAGSDTTASTLCSAILALVTHPAVVKAAQEEVDDIIGTKRSPTFEDEASLPYIRALVKEVLRWRPVAVLGGTPHATSEDDIYEGFRIPAGTTILGNTWAINHNPLYYPSPDVFDPARFLPQTDKRWHSKWQGEKKHPGKEGHSSFGWGRRICPGEGLARNSVFIVLAKLLWGFNIKATEGRSYDTMDYVGGFNIRPRSFECVFECRSAVHGEVLKEDLDAAQRTMGKFASYD